MVAVRESDARADELWTLRASTLRTPPHSRPRAGLQVRTLRRGGMCRAPDTIFDNTRFSGLGSSRGAHLGASRPVERLFRASTDVADSYEISTTQLRADVYIFRCSLDVVAHDWHVGTARTAGRPGSSSSLLPSPPRRAFARSECTVRRECVHSICV